MVANYANPTLVESAIRGIVQQDDVAQNPQQVIFACFKTLFLDKECQVTRNCLMKWCNFFLLNAVLLFLFFP